MRTSRRERASKNRNAVLVAGNLERRRSLVDFTFSSQHTPKKLRYQTEERKVINFAITEMNIPVFDTGISLIITGLALCLQLLRENFSRLEKISFRIAKRGFSLAPEWLNSYLIADLFLG